MAEWDDAPVVGEAPPAAPQAPSGNAWDAAPIVGSSARQKAVVSANDNGDEAARALKVGKQIGVPAGVVQSDLPAYDAHARQQEAAKGVENPYIAKYVNSHPSAASVSGDDYPMLDEVSQYLQNLSQDRINSQSTQGVLKGIPEVAQMLGSPAGREHLYNSLLKLPGALLEGVVDFAKTPGQVYSGEVNLNTPQGLDKGIGFGIGAALGGRDIQIGRAPKTVLPNEVSFEDFMSTLRGMETKAEMDAFLREKADAGGPPGAQLQITKAGTAADSLTKTIEAAQESKTKQRSPEVFEEFANAHDTGSVHIDPQKVMDLYMKEGKVPAEGDGLFGFVPNIVKQLEHGLETGTEVTIPVSKYVAHVDPAVHEGLKDSVRLHDDGVTLEEAEEKKKEIEAWHGTPHDFEKFDLTKIGTGEGAQVYGHGLYFAENTKVASGYKEQLTPGAAVDGQRFNANDPQHIAAEAIYNAGHIDKAQEALEKKLNSFTDKNDPFSAERDKLKQAIKELDKIGATGKPSFTPRGEGQLYKVSIKADPQDFLDLDQSLVDQPNVLDKIPQEFQKKLEAYLEEHDQGGELTDYTGRELQQIIERYATEDALPGDTGIGGDHKKEASEFFARLGIPGAKYLDQGSRGGVPTLAELRKEVADWRKKVAEREENVRYWGKEINKSDLADAEVKLAAVEKDLKVLEEGGSLATRNYVVFDDTLVKITEKNGSPVVDATIAAVEKAKAELYLEPLFKDEKTANITKPEFAQYSKKIDRAQEAVLAKAVDLAKREAAKRLTPEWKANEAELRGEVETDLRYDPAFVADRFFRTGEMPNGEKVAKPELIAENAEAFAPLFGFESGAALRKAVDFLVADRTAQGKGPKWQFDQAVKAETARRMEEKYGNLQENIDLAASEAALSDFEVDLLAFEMKMLAKAGGFEPPFTREYIDSFVKRQFDNSVASEVSYEKYRRAAEKKGREAEKALLKGDFVEAFKAKQAQTLSVVLAKEAKRFAKEAKRAGAKIERFTDEQQIDSMDQATLEQIRQMLAGVDVPQKWPGSVGPLPEFVAETEGQAAVAPWLMNGTAPALKDMTVQQFRDFADSLKSMEHYGRQVRTVENARNKALVDNVVFDAVKEMERFPFIDQPSNKATRTLVQRVGSVGRYVQGAHLLVERVFDYTDQFNPHGPITEFLDRPLRDSNAKEITLTEQVTKRLRDLKQYTDASVNEMIDNQVLPDAGMSNGLLKMNRQNLRQLMLNMGSLENIQKVTEGFAVPEEAVWGLINKHATANDWKWVQGVWDIFAHLKPEADAMQLRDTGVSVGEKKLQPIKNAHGDFEGGYYPIVYSRTNSNIVSHLAGKNPLFEPTYVAATTPHTYTKEVTGFADGLDLNGDFLATKLQGMVHDIAFREAVRNANKLISHPEFLKAVRQYWGNETAELLPGWLRNIANAHNFDDAYATGTVRAMSIIRQNVVSTLIAFNPGTYIKHGASAGIMSGNQVGFKNLLEAAKDIGGKDALKAAKDLVVRNSERMTPEEVEAFRDTLDQGQQGEDVRQFILSSSAVMRNRNRKVDDSIRGAVEDMNKAGVKKLLGDTRQNAMLLGRLAVAYSDQLTAMPTWYAAYKEAYRKGETHDDAVFIADKAVSRAHGSSFVGDQPRVTQLPNTAAGELARWFVPLYKFWNHQVNNEFQLAWDIAAKVRGPKEYKAGEAPPPTSLGLKQGPDGSWSYNPEPGTSAASIAGRIAQMLALILIEESATAALDEDKHGLITKTALAAARFFGGGFIGAREVTNALAYGNEPSVGLLGTVGKALYQQAIDLSKATSRQAEISKNWIIHAATTLGFATGIGGTQVGKTGSYIRDKLTGVEPPNQTFNQVRQGLRTGHSKPRKH